MHCFPLTFANISTLGSGIESHPDTFSWCQDGVLPTPKKVPLESSVQPLKHRSPSPSAPVDSSRLQADFFFAILRWKWNLLFLVKAVKIDVSIYEAIDEVGISQTIGGWHFGVIFVFISCIWEKEGMYAFRAFAAYWRMSGQFLIVSIFFSCSGLWTRGQ